MGAAFSSTDLAKPPQSFETPFGLILSLSKDEAKGLLRMRAFYSSCGLPRPRFTWLRVFLP